MNQPPYYVGTCNGYLMVETGHDERSRPYLRVYTSPDVRCATPFHSFEAADSAAKQNIDRMFPPDLAYFSIFCIPWHSAE